MHRRAHRGAALLCALLLQASAVRADSGPVPLTRLSLGEIGGWIELPVDVNGQRGRWLIDTGSTRHIVSAAFAQRHGLPERASARADTALGPVQGTEVALPPLHIGTHTHAGQTALRLDDLGTLVGPAGEGLDGILGVPLLAGVSLDLDLVGWTLTITDSVPAGCPADTLPLTLGTHRGLPVLDLRVNDGPAQALLLDTGNPAAVVQIEATEPDDATPGLPLAGGARLALAPRVAVGAWQRTNVPVLRLRAPGLHRALAPRVGGLVGTALLDGAGWRLHMDQRRACVTPNAPGLPGGFGLTLVQRAGGLFVDTVLPGGPAQAAGLQGGDAVRRWAGGGVDAPLRALWARVQGQDEVELQVGPDVRTLRLRRAHFLPRLP
ncbi:MAG: aspartyl protease family protein [Hydrogenophaga sp.]|uniref:retropepsin-like aspartic protease n=1 Tax=Hydrogenophaga sp. TaxID=1904254 RepID=UPI003D9AECAB